MSMPNIPDISPEINLCRSDVVNILLVSIALQEISLANILDMESKKIQKIVEKKERNVKINELTEVNVSVENVLDKVYKMETLLIEKLKIINDLS